MRTTLDLDEELLRAARRRARALGVSLKAVVEEALAASLARQPERAEPFRLDWRPHSGRFLARIDVADRDALHDAMEEE